MSSTSGVTNSTDWRVMVVPGKKHTGDSKQHRLESNGSAWEETHGIVNCRLENNGSAWEETHRV
jgi:hypothetical protein